MKIAVSFAPNESYYHRALRKPNVQGLKSTYYKSFLFVFGIPNILVVAKWSFRVLHKATFLIIVLQALFNGK